MCGWMTHTFMRLDSPSFMIVPLPKWPSMELTTLCSALAWRSLTPYRVSPTFRMRTRRAAAHTPHTRPNDHRAPLKLRATYPLGHIRPIAVTVCGRLLAGGAPRRRVRDERPSCGNRRSLPRSQRCRSARPQQHP
jgi:hypothetical protein